MILQTIATVTTLGLSTLGAPQDMSGVTLAQAQPFVGSQGYVAPSAGARDYMTTPEGCTYRRTQAPGYPERWILVVNPQGLGLPKPPRGCRGMR